MNLDGLWLCQVQNTSALREAGKAIEGLVTAVLDVLSTASTVSLRKLALPYVKYSVEQCAIVVGKLEAHASKACKTLLEAAAAHAGADGEEFRNLIASDAFPSNGGDILTLITKDVANEFVATWRLLMLAHIDIQGSLSDFDKCTSRLSQVSQDLLVSFSGCSCL